MSASVGLDSADKASFIDETISGEKQKPEHLGIQFLDYILPRSEVTGHRELHLIPLTVEKFVGKALYPLYKLQSGGSVPAKYKHYEEAVQRIGKALASESPRKGLEFEFAVVNDWSHNAWCLPGGKIAMNLGMLNAMENDTRDYGGSLPTFEEKVAAVLSHEITHATARHFGRTMEFKIFMGACIKGAQFGISSFVKNHYDKKIEAIKSSSSTIMQVTGLSDTDKKIKEIEKQKTASLKSIQMLFNYLVRNVASGIGKCKSRTHELEADKYGMILLHQAGKKNLAGFNAESARSAIWLQSFFIQHSPPSSPGFFDWLTSLISTHPSSHERLAANKKTWEKLQG
ncbi:MAG: M48 family metalloprotease [Rhabdochlamydiaceae bacterium]|nr:M48 family metalloprotease [Rhabdochlamydiaceae bacterium]